MRRFIFLIFIFSKILFSQNLEPPVNYDITSDYGPRNYNDYNWHIGIDYGTPMWTEVETVDSGNIEFIRSSEDVNRGGWRIRVNGDYAYWSYMHFFQNDPNPISPNNMYEAIQATLVNPNTGQNDPASPVYIFIFWSNRQNNWAEKVLAAFDYRERWIRWGEEYIRDENGDTILTKGRVEDREIIGPSGESGSAVGHPHLHFSAATENGYNYDINPLYHIIHDNPNYTQTINYPPENATLYHRPSLSETLQLNERIGVNVNSTTSCDLDRIFVYFFNPSEERVFDNTHMYAKVILGGLPPGEEFENVFPNRIINNGEANRGSLEQTGIDPQGVVPGTDDFYFIGGLIEGGFQFNTKINEQGTGDAKTNTEAKFKDGIKDMVIRAHSIRHNNQDYHTDSERQIILDNFAPFVEKVIVKKGGNVKYDAEWELIESGMQLNIPVKDNFSPEDEIHFEITFSEVMDANQINVKLEKSGHQIDVNQSGWNADYTIWEGDATIPDEEWVVGEVIISISSKDLAGNMLDRMPETIANRESNGSWSGYYEAGMDRNHKIYVGNAPIVISTEPSNGAQDVQVDVSPISIIFSKLMKTNGDAA